MKRRSLLAALVVSVALHACLLLFLWRTPRRPPPPPASRPLDVDIVFSGLPAETPLQQGTPAEGPRQPTPRPPSPRPLAEAPRPAAPEPPPPASPMPPPAKAPRPAGEQELSLDAPDMPAGPRVTLVPRSDFPVPVTPGLSEGAAPSAQPGRTQRATDAPENAAERLAREAAEARTRVQDWAVDALAEGRVRDGRLHPYYVELRRALEAQVRTPPKGLALPNVPQELVAGYLKKMQRYGAGQAPEADFAMGTERELQTIAQGMPPFERALTQDASAASAVGRRIWGKAEKPPPALRAVVEIRQGPDGRLTDKVLLTSSGNPLFDRHALESAQRALESMASPPADVATRGLRSTWACEGRVDFKRKLRDFDLKNPGDAAYLAALLGTGQLAGSFDLTNLKDLDVPDVRSPRWDIRPVLLKVY
ncbi:MAG: TonB C-terminal domain-containing protein [Myxococcaceae bacterium]|nr:TonB C-terminal domain-containing protein [Myxococcaceae bacterium]